MTTTVSLNTLHRAFQASAEKQGDIIEDGADYRSPQNKNPVHRFLNALCNLFTIGKYSTNTKNEISAKREALKEYLPELLREMKDSGKNIDTFGFSFTVNDHPYTLKQEFGSLTLCDENNPAKSLTLQNITFEELQKAIEKKCAQLAKNQQEK